MGPLNLPTGHAWPRTFFARVCDPPFFLRTSLLRFPFFFEFPPTFSGEPAQKALTCLCTMGWCLVSVLLGVFPSFAHYTPRSKLGFQVLLHRLLFFSACGGPTTKVASNFVFFFLQSFQASLLRVLVGDTPLFKRANMFFQLGTWIFVGSPTLTEQKGHLISQDYFPSSSRE